MSSSVLLRGGMLLVPDETNDNAVIAVKRDLLVMGDRIARIEQGIAAQTGMTVIDCAGKIVSPGFIDTHHHLWQTPLKGRHGDHSVLDYMPTGNLSSAFFTPADMFWGQLGGALEALDAGTTTVVDHAHMNVSEQHSNYALAATLTSGVRSVFCYTPTPLVTSWRPKLTLCNDLLQPWHLSQINHLSNLLGPNPRISLGFGFDGYAFLSPDAIQSLFSTVRAAGVRLITSHSFRNPLLSQKESVISTMAEMGLLAEDVIIAHATGTTPGDEELLAKHGASVAWTPGCEMMQGLGTQTINCEGRIRLGLGCDSHTVVRGSMLDQMRLALTVDRMQRTQVLLDQNTFPRTLKPSVQDAFQLATCHGARAIGRESDLGSLKVGYKADIVVLDCQNPNMVCVGRENALTAVVCHAGVRDVDCVIVDGVIRKQKGRLVDCTLSGHDENLLSDKGFARGAQDNILSWDEVAAALERSREEIQLRMAQEGVSNGPVGLTDALIGAFGLDGGVLVGE